MFEKMFSVVTDQGRLATVSVVASTVAVLAAGWRFRKNPGVWTAVPVAAEMLVLAEQVHRKLQEA